METRTETAARGFDPDALTRALRIAGAALVVTSASSFMLQHWQGGNDLTRYAMLVGQSLLLAAAAYFVGLTLREGRSARTLLSLVLATMPVSFAVLGGLVYSQFHLESVRVLPGYATWIAPSPASALLAVCGTLVVLVPLGVIAFVALARKEARALSWAFFAGNSLILVPVRQPYVVALLAGVALIALLKLELSRFSLSAQLDTLEGKLARALPFAAPLFLLGRVFHLYEVGAPFVGAVLLTAACALWMVVPRTTVEWKRDAGTCTAAALAAAGWGLCRTGLLDAVPYGTPRALLFGLPIAALFVVASRRAVRAERALIGLATGTALATSLLCCAFDCSSTAAVACVVVGVGVAVWGASLRAPLRTLSGSIVAFSGLALQMWLATRADDVLRWSNLSIMGILLIIGSAYVERNRGRLQRARSRGPRAGTGQMGRGPHRLPCPSADG